MSLSVRAGGWGGGRLVEMRVRQGWGQVGGQGLDHLGERDGPTTSHVVNGACPP